MKFFPDLLALAGLVGAILWGGAFLHSGQWAFGVLCALSFAAFALPMMLPQKFRANEAAYCQLFALALCGAIFMKILNQPFAGSHAQGRRGHAARLTIRHARAAATSAWACYPTP